MGTTTQLAPVRGPVEKLLVVVVSGPEAGRSVVVDHQVLVGSSELCDLQLSDRTVSRRHLTLSPGTFGLRLLDQDSRNGTWVDETRLSMAEVPAGREIRVGGTTLRVERRADETDGAESPSATERMESFGRFLGRATVLEAMYERLNRASETDVTVLLEGESGTGKELIAEAIHERGSRRAGPFVVVDCGAVAEGLLESELFGHERGAFTGAERARMGAFEAAQGGTVFLDEIGELGLGLQTRLLRVLDQRRIRRIGSQKVVELDVRIIAATNRNLEREVEESRFRLDLFHRLAVLLVQVPPLRERGGDIELLARHFMDLCKGDPALLSADVLNRLEAHRWPGNVRELRNYMERFVLLGDSVEPYSTNLGGDTLEELARSGMPYREARAQVVSAFTERYVDDMLARHDGNVSQAARSAGVARRHFQRLKQK